MPGARDLSTGQLIALPGHDARASHLREVVKAEVGDTIRVGAVDGLRGDACVVALGAAPNCSVDLCVTSTYPPLPAPTLNLLLALPRPKVLKRLWPVLAELGLGTVMLCGAERVEKSFFASKVLVPEKVREGLVKGLEQAGDTRLPHIMLSRTLKGALAVLPGKNFALEHPEEQHVHEALAAASCQQQQQQQQQCGQWHAGTAAQFGDTNKEQGSQGTLPWGVTCLVQGSPGAHTCQPYMARLLAHPRSGSPALMDQALVSLQRQQAGGAAAQGYRMLIAIGPEGGWKESELDMLSSLGSFTCVHLGERTYTTTTALIAAVGAVQAAQQAMLARAPTEDALHNAVRTSS